MKLLQKYKKIFLGVAVVIETNSGLIKPVGYLRLKIFVNLEN